MSFVIQRMLHFPIYEPIRVLFKRSQARTCTKIHPPTVIVCAGVFLRVGQFPATSGKNDGLGYRIHDCNYKIVCTRL